MREWHHKTQRGGILTFRGTTCTIEADGRLNPQPTSKDLAQLRWLHTYPHVELAGVMEKPEDTPTPEPDPEPTDKKALAALKRKVKAAATKAEAAAKKPDADPTL